MMEDSQIVGGQRRKSSILFEELRPMMMCASKVTLAHQADPQCLVDAIQFNAELAFWQNNPDWVRLVYKLSINRFRGNETLQLLIDYATVAAAD